ncbi:MAG: VanW family protein [Clostridia bacterium]|nr:VanW family protein [Clostridia bacterium]
MRNGRRSRIQTAALLISAYCFFGGGFCVKPRTACAESGTISSYTTYFSTDDRNRTENIKIAAKLIDGVTIQAYGEFSFNQTVGRRTQEAGFKQAKIIVNGEYVLGTGGGVCQVSTTLYNAALKSGLEIVEYHPHSLQVSYVAPSRDAMVSTGSDLKIFNAHAYPVKLSATAENGAVRVHFSGQKDGYRYEITSETIAEIPPPTPIVKDGDREEILRSPKNGVKSQAYIERYFGDKLVSRKKLRDDEYRPIQGIIVKKIGNTDN